MKTYLTLALSLIVITAAHAQGTFVLWDESVNGLFSNNSTTPTQLGALSAGTNSVRGATELVLIGSNGAIYEDYFTIAVRGGNEVSSLGFFADRPVAIWFGSSDFTLESHYLINPPPGDLLSALGVSALGAGSYGIHIGNFDFGSSSVATYRLDFVVVPEPNVLALLLLAGGLWLSFGRRDR